MFLEPTACMHASRILKRHAVRFSMIPNCIRQYFNYCIVIKVYVQLYIIDGIIDAELDQTVYRACTLQTISMKFLLPTTVVTLTYE